MHYALLIISLCMGVALYGNPIKVEPKQDENNPNNLVLTIVNNNKHQLPGAIDNDIYDCTGYGGLKLKEKMAELSPAKYKENLLKLCDSSRAEFSAFQLIGYQNVLTFEDVRYILSLLKRSDREDIIKSGDAGKQFFTFLDEKLQQEELKKKEQLMQKKNDKQHSYLSIVVAMIAPLIGVGI